MTISQKSPICILLLVCSLTLGHFSGHAQKKVHLEIGKKQYPDILSTGGDDLVVQIGNTLSRYSAQGELVWKHELSKGYSDLSINNRVIFTPSSSFMYQIAYKGEPEDFNNSPFLITQISQSGNVKTFKLPRQASNGKSLLTFFTDDQYLYYLAAAEGYELDKKKRNTEKIILNRYAHGDQTHTRIELKLPSMGSFDDSEFWNYLGHANGVNYLISKGLLEDGSGQAFMQLAGFNSDGEVVIEKTLKVILKDKFVRPVATRLEGSSFTNFRNFDRYFTGGRITTYAQTSGAFSALQLDAKNKCFYAFGLLGPEPFKRVAPEYEGFYVIKFDLDGKEIWRIENSGDKELVEDRIFFRGAAPLDRTLFLNPMWDGSLTLGIIAIKLFVTFTITPEGKLLERDAMPVDSTEVGRFIKSKISSEDVSYQRFATNKADVILLHTKDSYDLYFFPGNH